VIIISASLPPGVSPLPSQTIQRPPIDRTRSTPRVVFSG
jgi:hypothetical protein